MQITKRLYWRYGRLALRFSLWLVLAKVYPDLLVGYKGQTLLFEVKDGFKPPSARLLTEDQLRWHGVWKGGALAVVDSPDAALRMIGVIK
jgi:hypothetical protein